MPHNVNEQKHADLLRAQAAECTVLLASDGSFPLAAPGQIALFGSGARNTIKGGTGSGEVNSRYFVTVEQGLKNAGFTVTTTAWMDAYDRVREAAWQEFMNVIRARAKANHTMAVIEGMGAVMPEPEYQISLDAKGEAAIYVLSRISGEGNDRAAESGDILLSETEKRDILALNERFEKFLLVLNVGGPVDLTPVLGVKNILVLSQLGVSTGDVLADIVLGKANPSGKLTTTWSAWTDYFDGDFGDINDTRYQEGIYVGYRYFDSVGKKALFPFGFGKSFTTFDVAYGKTSAVPADGGVCVEVTAKVTNTGAKAGKEVVQVYASVPEGKLDQPFAMLAGFAKTKELAPGESEEVAVRFPMELLSGYDAETAQYILEAGDYILRLGTSSADHTAVSALSLDRTVVTRQVRNALGNPGFTDWKPSEEDKAAAKALRGEDGAVETVAVDASAFKTQTPVYDTEPEIDPLVRSLTDAELANMSCGFHTANPIGSIIGGAGDSVPGAAGETSNILKDRGVLPMVMADGPAGLRLTREYFVNAKGKKEGLGVGMPESITSLMPGFLVKFMTMQAAAKRKKATDVQEQDCTAIPIGTAIAQSFNPAYAELCGDIVGTEMELFGIHLWLAPALNIHRSIRCGRNFEYFSEDPLVSGLFAAAITKGVQKHPGCGTTIKHYAANNQETNRYNNNSRVSERAMREIYLKGFDICVHDSQPHALMTSYNLLNGEHTSERYDLIEDILRAEFGYEGIVMTDWVVNGGTMNKASIHRAPQAARVTAAGNDLMMPGSAADEKDILKGLSDGRTTRKQLEINISRVLRMVRKLVK